MGGKGKGTEVHRLSCQAGVSPEEAAMSSNGLITNTGWPGLQDAAHSGLYIASRFVRGGLLSSRCHGSAYSRPEVSRQVVAARHL